MANDDAPPKGWTIKLGGQPCSSPQSLAESLDDHPFRDELPVWRRANSYECPRGQEVGRGYVLMQREYLDKLDANAYHSLVFVNQFETVTIKSLVIVSAKSMFGQTGEKACSMLVELADRRLVISRSSVNNSYNRLIPAPPNPDVSNNRYYPESLNGGSAWTWQTMLNDLWDVCNDKVGALTLPATVAPSSNPENFTFIGQSPWKAIHVVLAQLGCTTAYDPIADTFSVVHLGDTQEGLVANARNLKKRLRQDYDTNNKFNAANVPSQVRVFFPRTDKWRGIEKDTPRSSNWEMNCYSPITVATEVSGAKGVMPVNGDLWALIDRDNTVVNQSALQSRADAIAADVAANTPKLVRRVYAGAAQTILPGSEISRVTWRDYGDYDRNVGQITIVEHKQWCRYYEEAGWGIESESVQPVDIARKTYPNYPDLLQLVQVYDSYQSEGVVFSPSNGELPGESPVSVKVFPGRVRLIRNNVETMDECWIIDMTDYGTLAGDTQLTNHAYYHGRLSGTAKSGGLEFPLYSITTSATPFKVKYVKLTETLTPGSWASGRLVEYDATTSTWVEPDEEADDVTLLDLLHPDDAAGNETSELAGWNEGLENEVFPCYYDPDASWTDYSEEPPVEYEGAYIVLSQLPWAVRRFAKVTATGDGIALGGSGDVEIYHKGDAGGENEPIASGVTVTAWALKWHHTAAIATGTKVMIQWQPDQRRWWIERLSSTGGGGGGGGAILGYAMVAQDFCAGDETVACTSLIPFNGETCGDDVGTPDLKNTYGLAAKAEINAPTKVLVVYDCVDGWTIIQVLHYEFNMLTSTYLTQSGDPFTCELSIGAVTKVAVPYCGTTSNTGLGMSKFETWGAMRTFTAPDGVCRLQAKKLVFCSFTDPEDEDLQDLDTWHDVLDFTSQQVVVNVYDNGIDAIQQTVLTLWVPCVDDDADEQLVVEYEECDPP